MRSQWSKSNVGGNMAFAPTKYKRWSSLLSSCLWISYRPAHLLSIKPSTVCANPLHSVFHIKMRSRSPSMSRSAKDLQLSSDAESDHPDYNTEDHSKVTNRGAPARHSRRQRSEVRSHLNTGANRREARTKSELPSIVLGTGLATFHILRLPVQRVARLLDIDWSW